MLNNDAKSNLPRPYASTGHLPIRWSGCCTVFCTTTCFGEFFSVCFLKCASCSRSCHCKLMFLTNILHFSSKIFFPTTVITYHEVLLNIIYEHQILVTLVIVQPVTFFLTLSNSFFTVCYLFQLPLIYIICCSTYQIVLHPSISSSIYYATVQYQCSRIRGHPNL